VAATLPWIVYFNAHGALHDLFTVYFYNNVFLYADPPENIINSILQNMQDTWAYAVLIAAGLIWCSLTRQVSVSEKISVAALFTLTGAGIYAAQPQAYAPLPLGVFAPLGAIAALDIIKIDLFNKYSIRIITSCCVTVACIVYAYFCSYNTHFFMAARDAFPQFRFAEIMNEMDDPKLLNYGFMDEGFYTTADVVPNTRHYCMLNILRDEAALAHDSYLSEGTVDFVVSKDEMLDTDRFWMYELVAEGVFHAKSYTSEFYLYRLKYF
jgi:hypothetical protein